MQSVLFLTLVIAVGINANCNSVEISPVCGSDSNTYTDLCAILAAKEADVNFVIVSENACSLPDLPDCTSYPIHLVCGSDRKHYFDICDLLKAKHYDPNFTILHKSYCYSITDPDWRTLVVTNPSPIITLPPVHPPIEIL